jgi:hypothetical protein
LTSSRFARFLLCAASAFSLAVLAGACSSSEPGDEASAPPAPPAATVKESEKFGRAIAAPPEALQAARRFVQAAVLRTDLDAAWDLTAPELRNGYTRDQWLTGSIPVVPFPESDFERALFKVIEAYERDIWLEVHLVPQPESDLETAAFYMHLKPDGKRWLVSYWAPRGSGLGGLPGT